MSDVLSALVTFPPDDKKLSPRQYDHQINTFLKELGKIPNSGWTKTVVDKKGLLEMLDPAVNSIAYLVTLNKQIVDAGKDTKRLEQLFALAQVFLTSFDPIQIR